MAATSTKSGLFRGNNYGVFTGPNGYYVAKMARDGVTHYQPANGGGGWKDSTKERCNSEARELDANPHHDYDDEGSIL